MNYFSDWLKDGYVGRIVDKKKDWKIDEICNEGTKWFKSMYQEKEACTICYEN